MKKLAFFGAFLLTPILVSAQIRDAEDLADTFIGIINNIAVPLLFAVSFLVFIFGVFRYFIAGGADEEKRKQATQMILYGIIGFALMVSVWGLVNILLNTFDLQQNVPKITPPIRSIGN